MSLAPRPTTPPRVMTLTCVAVSAVAGAGLVALGPQAPPSEPAGLTPRSVTTFLADLPPDGARELRVNGVYGSGHHGAWQFVAHISWRNQDGTLSGGSTVLPRLISRPPLNTQLAPGKLDLEQRIGWTLEDLDRVLGRLEVTAEPLAMLELAIPPDGIGRVIACRADSADQIAVCEERDRAGRRTRRFQDRLTDAPLLGELSVQRVSSPVQSEAS